MSSKNFKKEKRFEYPDYILDLLYFYFETFLFY